MSDLQSSNSLQRTAADKLRMELVVRSVWGPDLQFRRFSDWSGLLQQSRPVGEAPQLQSGPPNRQNYQVPCGAYQQQFAATSSSSSGHPLTGVVIPNHQGAVRVNVTILNANAQFDVNLIRKNKQEPLDEFDEDLHEDYDQLYQKQFDNMRILTEINEDLTGFEVVSTNSSSVKNSNSGGNQCGNRGGDGGDDRFNKNASHPPNGSISRRERRGPSGPEPNNSSSDEGKGIKRGGKDKLSKFFVDKCTYRDPENARRGTLKCNDVSFARGTSHQPAIREPGEVRVTRGSGEGPRLLGFVKHPVVFSATLHRSEFGLMALLPYMRANIMADILSRLPFASGVEKTEGSQNAEVQTSAVHTLKVITADPDPILMNTREQSAGTLYIGHPSIKVDTADSEDGNMDTLAKTKIEEEGESDSKIDKNLQSRPLATLIVERVQLSIECDPTKDFSILTGLELAETQQAVSTVQVDKRMLKTGEVPTAYGLLNLSDFMNEYGQLVDPLKLHINGIILLKANKPEKAVIFIPADLVRQLSNSECVGAVQQQQSGLQPVNEGGRGNSLVVIVLNGQGSSPLIASSNRALAIAVALTYQSFNSIIRAILINSIIAYGTQRIILFNLDFSLKSNIYQNLSNLFNFNMVKSSILYHKSIASISFDNSIGSLSKHAVLSEALASSSLFSLQDGDGVSVRVFIYFFHSIDFSIFYAYREASQ